jgi:hypothetical protein
LGQQPSSRSNRNIWLVTAKRRRLPAEPAADAELGCAGNRSQHGRIGPLPGETNHPDFVMQAFARGEHYRHYSDRLLD